MGVYDKMQQKTRIFLSIEKGNNYVIIPGWRVGSLGCRGGSELVIGSLVFPHGFFSFSGIFQGFHNDLQDSDSDESYVSQLYTSNGILI